MRAWRNAKLIQAMIWVLVAVGSAVLFTGRQAVQRLALTGAGWLIGYPKWSGGPVGVAVAITGLILAWFLLRRWLAFLRRAASPVSGRWLDVAAPLELMPLLAAARMLAILPGIVGTICSHALFYGVPLVAALCLERIAGEYHPAARMDISVRTVERRWVLLAFVLLWGGYFELGLGINSRIGETMGDEAHYLTMAESLHNDGDLDLSNNLPTPLTEEARRNPDLMAHFHVRASPHGGLYSYHSFGLPLVAFPFNQWGLAGRQLFLALLSAWSTIGAYILCRRYGAGVRSSCCACLALVLGFAWSFYAIRYLPEMFGCGLAVWALWAVWAQRSRPMVATVVALLCCVYLPVAHARFVTPSVMLAAAFCVELLFLAEEPWRRRMVRLFAFGLLYAAGALGLLMCNRYMFGVECAYNPGMILRNPWFMWGMFVDNREIVVGFPLVFLFFMAPLVLLCRPAVRSRMLLWPFLVLAGILITSCSVYISGGNCAPGRFLLMALPLFAPMVALALEGSGRGARIWFWFLGLLPVPMLIAVLYVGKGFVVALAAHSVRQVLLHPAEPVPLISVLAPPFPGAMALASAVSVLLFAISFFLLTRPFRLRNTLLGCAATFVIIVTAFLQQKTESGAEALDIFSRRIAMENYRWLRTPAPTAAVSVLDVFNRHVPREMRPLLITTLPAADIPSDPGVALVPIREMGPNDWKSRGWYWHLLLRPVTLKYDGRLLFRIAGEVSGDATAIFAFRHGSYTLDDSSVRKKSEAFNLLFTVPVAKDRGDLMPLVRLEGGEGTLRIHAIQFALFTDQMLAEAGLALGEGEVVGLQPENTRYEP